MKHPDHRSLVQPGPRGNTSRDAWLAQFDIAVIIPAYNVAREIGAVLEGLPPYVRRAIVVDDASRDDTARVVGQAASGDSRITLVTHESNQGVGGAMVTGFQKALETGAQIAVKIDGDGQMSPDQLPGLLIPLIRGDADYSKGNRFRDFRALREMPALRRIGNMALSFLAKAATGYWHCFDPTNGFVAIRTDILRDIPLRNTHRTYFFEISILSQLYLLGAVVREVPMPAMYGEETSSLHIRQVIREFPARLVSVFIRRLVLKNFIYDFTMESLYLLCGIPLMIAGMTHGAYNWARYASQGVAAPTGTIMISVLSIMISFQILLAAVGIDLGSVPTEPVNSGPLEETRDRDD